MGQVDIISLLEEVDVTTQEALAYTKYFDFLRQKGRREKWEKFTIRAFILSISEIKKGYYSVLRKVKDEVLFRDPAELDRYQWLKGWIFQKADGGVWFIVVDGDSEPFRIYKQVYEELREQ